NAGKQGPAVLASLREQGGEARVRASSRAAARGGGAGGFAPPHRRRLPRQEGGGTPAARDRDGATSWIRQRSCRRHGCGVASGATSTSALEQHGSALTSGAQWPSGA